MNNKGFTLVEVLAVVVILGIILGIATYSVIGIIETSRTKSEQIFVEKLSKLIDDYIDLESSNFKEFGAFYDFQKCNNSDACYESTAREINKITCDGNDCSFHLSDLVDAGLVLEDDIKNPRNKKYCLDDKDPVITIYKDSEYVYYYYVNLSGDKTSCGIEKNGIIDTFPEEFPENLKKGELEQEEQTS